jgi:hypothetical protein
VDEGPPSGGSRPLRSEFEHQLTKGGCPACGYVEDAEQSFFAWFEIQSFSATEVKSSLRAAIGMCPAQTRDLIEQIGGGHIMTIVMREALAGARECVSGVASRPRCPACEADALATDRRPTSSPMPCAMPDYAGCTGSTPESASRTSCTRLWSPSPPR